MIKKFDYYRQVEDPIFYLCNPDKKYIGVLNASERNLSLKFNDLCTLTFTASEPINSVKSGSTQTLFDKINTKRLVFADQIGWFVITSAVESDDGEYKYKNVTCQSEQYELNNIGIYTEDRIYRLYNPEDPKDELYDSSDASAITSVVGQLNKQLGFRIEVSDTDFDTTEDYGVWTLTYVSPALEAVYRTLEETSVFGYDFIKNTVSDAYDVIFEFDMLHHTVKIKPASEITIPTDIYLSFSNLVNQIDITENSDDIVTVLTCNGKDVDITTVNPMGTNYLVNFDCYMKEIQGANGIEYPWMSAELIAALKAWKAQYDTSKTTYESLVRQLAEHAQIETKVEEKLQYATIKERDLQAVKDKYATEEFDGIIAVEDVDAENRSLKSSSYFYNHDFADTYQTTAYKVAPTATLSAGHYTFSFPSGAASRTGTLATMLNDYMPSETDDGESTSTAYLYFKDGDNNSYCKAIVKGEVVVAKDADGVVAKLVADEDRTATIGGVTFTLRLNNNALQVKVGSTAMTLDADGVFTYNNARYQATRSADDYATIHKFYVSGFRRFTKPTEVVGDNGWLNLWGSRINTLKGNLETAQTDIASDQAALKNATCEVKAFIKGQPDGDKLYSELSHYWIEGDYSNDNIAVQEDATIDETIEIAEELIEAGNKELEKVSQPTYTLKVDAVNFTNLIEFKNFTDQLELGRVITIEKGDNEWYYPALISIDLSLDDLTSFSLEFSNATNTKQGMMTYADLVKTSSSVSRTVSANWTALTEYSKEKEEIQTILDDPLNRALRSIRANMTAQEFTIDTTGILGRKYTDSSTATFSPKQMRIINNQLVFTDDNWETCKLALGEIEYGTIVNGETVNSTAYGLAAEVLIGRLILGENMQIRNLNSSISLDKDGITIKNSNNEVVFQAKSDGTLTVRNYATSADLATTNSNVGTLEGRVNTAEGDIDDLETWQSSASQTISTHSTQIETNSQAITLKASQSDLNTLSGRVTETEANITANSEKISAEVTRATEAENQRVTQTGGNDASFSWSLTADGFVLKSNNTTVMEVTSSGLTVTGSITSTSGTIGGFTIDSNSLHSGTFGQENSVLICTGTSGTANIGGSGSISGWAITAGSTFGVTKGGALYATSGKIGGFTIGSDTLATESGKIYLASSSGKKTVALSPGELTVAKYKSSGWFDSSQAITITDSSILFTYGGATRSISCGTLGIITMKTNDYNYLQLGNLGAALYGLFLTIDSQPSEGSGGNIAIGTYYATDITIGRSTLSNGALTGTWKLNGSSIATTSDINLKNTIKEMPDIYSDLFDNLHPVVYKYNDGTSGRFHAGFIAQDVRDATILAGLTTQDFAGYIESLSTNKETGETTKTCYLRYEEFIALNTSEIQKLKARVKTLEDEIKELKGE